MIERTKAPNLALHLDTFHMNIEEDNFCNPVIAAGDRLKHIHMTESNRGMLGEGNVHWDDLFRGLASIDFKENLEALTLSCFKLIEQIDTTGCVALSLLNDDGIIAGCEGDLQSVFTLLAVKALTGKDGFMANPSMINTRTNELILAHCTVGLKQTERYIIRNHFETEKGIAIQGLLPTGDVTIIKCGGECLDEYYLSTGTLTENTNYINMCRTQVRIHMNTPAEYFLKNPLGNHHIMLHGNYEDTLNEFFQANACKRTE
jgi:L-fucose isomerase-like protein